MTARGHVLLAITAVATGAIIADAAVAVTAGAVVGAAALARVRLTSFAAGAAAVAVAGAGLATLFEADLDPDQVNVAFADARPFAAQLGGLAAVLMVVAVLAAAIEARARRGDADGGQPTATEAHQQPWRVPADIGLLLTGAGLVRLLGAPSPLSPAQRSLSDNIDAGLGLLFGPPGQAEPTTYLMPFPATLDSLGPLPGRLLVASISTATVLAVFVLAERLFDRRVARTAGWLAALLPSLWGQQLPETLAAFAATTALVLAVPALPLGDCAGSPRPGGLGLGTRPRREEASGEAPTAPAEGPCDLAGQPLTRSRAILVGLAIALAAYSRPECLLLVPVVAAWWAFAEPQVRRRIVAMAAVVVLVIAPWSLWAHSRTGSWLPTTSFGPTMAAGSSAGVTGSLAGAADPALSPGPNPDEAADDRAARSEVWRDLGHHLSPDLVARRVLRGWDVWSYPAAKAARGERGLPLPGGPIGGLLEVIAAGLAGYGAWRFRSRWQDLLPLSALPALFTIETALTFGDRGLRAWVAPSVAILAGAAVIALVDVRRRRVDRSQTVTSAS